MKGTKKVLCMRTILFEVLDVKTSQGLLQHELRSTTVCNTTTVFIFSLNSEKLPWNRSYVMSVQHLHAIGIDRSDPRQSAEMHASS